MSKILTSGFIVGGGVKSSIKISSVTYDGTQYTITGSGFTTQSDSLRVLIDGVMYAPDYLTADTIMITLSKLYNKFQVINENEASKVYNGSFGSNIVFQFASTSFYLPLSGRKNNQSAPYNWSVSVDGTELGTYSGTSSLDSSKIALRELLNTTHTVTIKPADGLYSVGWGCAFGFWDNTYGANETTNKDKLTAVLNDPDWAHLYTETDTGDYFRMNQYMNCTKLVTIPDEDMPEGVEYIGAAFRHRQYMGCTSIKTAAAEHLPDSLTSIYSDFRNAQYEGCTALTTAAAEVLPDSVTSIDIGFRYRQYYNCSSLTVKNYTHHRRFATLVNTSDYHYNQMFKVDTARTLADGMPYYYTGSGTTQKLVDTLTLDYYKDYITNRTGITGYNAGIDEKWKS
jgi:hypothetical protein